MYFTALVFRLQDEASTKISAKTPQRGISPLCSIQSFYDDVNVRISFESSLCYEASLRNFCTRCNLFILRDPPEFVLVFYSFFNCVRSIAIFVHKLNSCFPSGNVEFYMFHLDNVVLFYYVNANEYFPD